jgi:WD40 repeat protein
MWNEGDLSKWTAEVPLKHGRENSEEVTVSCIDVPSRENNSVLLGADDGHLYKARLFDRPGVYEEMPPPPSQAPATATAQNAQELMTNYHHAPITNLHFHPLTKHSPSNVADFFLTSSYDWTVKLWSNKLSRPLMTFESAREYVLDVQWSPVHPSLFAAGDALGFIHLWNINTETEIPIRLLNVNSPHSRLLLPNAPSAQAATATAAASSSTSSSTSPLTGPSSVPSSVDGLEEESGLRAPAVSRLRWSDDGNMICAGTSRGLLYVYEMPTHLTQPTKDDGTDFVNKIQKSRNLK